MENRFGTQNVEVINLGVSATDPDEYYYRIRNIATKLDIDHCVLFLYAGNDFSAPARTLPTTAGIAAVYPRGSLLSSLGMHSLNHILTNKRRPVLQTWFSGGDLLAAETRLAKAFADADYQGIRDLLYSTDYHTRSPRERSVLASRLNAPEMASFFEVLRNPDKGLFRSYYLKAALWSASVGGGQWLPLSENAAMHWIVLTDECCRAHGVAFTLVVIPEAFQVDVRMMKQWESLADMRLLTATCRTTAARLVDRVKKASIQTIDLHDSFDGVSGTYLNMDGHWSDDGVELAGKVVYQRLQTKVRSQSP